MNFDDITTGDTTETGTVLTTKTGKQRLVVNKRRKGQYGMTTVTRTHVTTTGVRDGKRFGPLVTYGLDKFTVAIAE